MDTLEEVSTVTGVRGTFGKPHCLGTASEHLMEHTKNLDLLSLNSLSPT